MSQRKELIENFLCGAGWQNADRRALAADASFRRYERLCQGEVSAVLMDAPPPAENVRPFIKIANLLRSVGLSAPEILAQNTDDGLLLLEDFGDATYTQVLADGGDEAGLYALAIDALIHLHRTYKNDPAIGVPPYDDQLLVDEAFLLTDWYLPAVRGVETSPAARSEYRTLWHSAFAQARAVPDSLVLRDFHVDNLIWLKDRSGSAACGLLDFQDAVIGPVSYDVVSLLEDARRNVSSKLSAALLRQYCRAFPGLDVDRMMASYAVLGAQRSAKILGIFTRLDRRDGKSIYLHHIERVWRWLEGDLEHPVLKPLRNWFDEIIPKGSRLVPDAVSKG
jgi:aminoglycoside/choline kinase family phosphotransferase